MRGAATAAPDACRSRLVAQIPCYHSAGVPLTHVSSIHTKKEEKRVRPQDFSFYRWLPPPPWPLSGPKRTPPSSLDYKGPLLSSEEEDGVPSLPFPAPVPNPCTFSSPEFPAISPIFALPSQQATPKCQGLPLCTTLPRVWTPLLLNSSATPSRGRIYHETYGCQMNINDMEIVLSIMRNAGYKDIVETPESAEIIFINTCAIRDNAEQRVWQRLNYFWFLKRHWKSNVAIGRSQSWHPPKVVVLGCMAERLKEKILDADKMVDVVCGPDAYRDLPRLLEAVDYGQKGINTLLSLEETYADITPVRISSNSVTAFVSIMRGCNNMCSFCIVPFTRGRERSRPVASIVREVGELLKEGVKEVTLLGQNVNSYNDSSGIGDDIKSGTDWKFSEGFSSMCKIKNMGKRFSDLLDILSSEFPEMRFRFTSPHPKDFPDELLYLMRDRYNICKIIHLPAQTGSTAVLERMRRGYTREAYLDLVQKIRKIIPDVALSSDFITDVKQRRLTELIDTFRETTGHCYDSQIGTLQLVLVEGPNKRAPDTELIGKSDKGHRVTFQKVALPCLDSNLLGANPDADFPTKREPVVGDFVEVHILRSTRASLFGEALAITSLSKFHSKECTTDSTIKHVF
ncbi:CDK5RAP1-like protein [Nymphaea thermarum]|nr:CDK5RAP1-like protein [Nymphaea thermarum]